MFLVFGRERTEDKQIIYILIIHMKTDDFKNILRNTVNEELRKVLPELLNEYFNKSDKSAVADRKSQTIPIPTQQPSTIIDNTVKKELRQYVKNPILNQILNETVVKIPTDGSVVSPGQYTHSAMDSKEIPQSLSNVFNKNYSTLLKAIDVKTKK